MEYVHHLFSVDHSLRGIFWLYELLRVKMFSITKRSSEMVDIDLYAQIADLKEIDYRNTLAIATIIEI